MDNLSPATIEVPNFKLAKVGKDRERKRGGATWFGGRAVNSSFSGAMGGSGAGGGVGLFGLGTSVTKMLLTLAISTIATAGAWQYGKMSAAKSAQKPAASHKLFEDKNGPQKYDDLSGVVKEDNSIPNSLGYVSGSTDGLTPEERAKKAAEAEAARKADEEAARKAEEDAKKEPATPAAAPADPKALAEAAMPKKGLSAGKFGQLGSSFGGGGGGLSGGAGLSGGINRNFGAASGMNAKPQNGSLGNFRNATKVASASSPHALAAKSKSKGFAKRQLDNAFTQSRQAMSAGKGETAASSAAAPFDNNPGIGNVIAGPGVGNTHAASGDGGNSINPTNTGGPMGDGATAACQSGFAPDINGNCQAIQSGNGKKAARDQGLIDMAQMLMLLTAVFAGLVWLFKGKGPWGEMIADAFVAIIMVLGGIIAALGVAIMASSGDKVVGGIITACGLFTMASAYFPATGANQVVNIAAGAFISNALGLLAASAAHKPQMD